MTKNDEKLIHNHEIGVCVSNKEGIGVKGSISHPGSWIKLLQWWTACADQTMQDVEDRYIDMLELDWASEMLMIVGLA